MTRFLSALFFLSILLFISVVTITPSQADPCCIWDGESCITTANFIRCNDNPQCYAQCMVTTCEYNWNKIDPPCDDNYVTTWSFSKDCEQTNPYCPCDIRFIMDEYLTSHSLCSEIPN